MAAQGTARDGLASVLRPLDTVLGDPRAQGVYSIGVSVPGWVDIERGVLLSAANIPCWRNFPLVREIRKHCRLPVQIGNDANVAALAEAHWGAGRGRRRVFYVTLGTGIGTGIVLDGHVYAGRSGGASEGGHVSINFRGPRCGCGKRGCIEVYASGTAIARRARRLESVRGARRSLLLRLARGNVSAISAEHVVQAGAAGDALAARILGEAAEALAIWLGNMIDLLEPDIIVVGGGIGRPMMSMREQVRQSLERWSANPRWRQIPIVLARYRADSALVGAAALGMAGTP